jgi:2-keto-4-pentenoate hydratase/2-oxohepta-3-ene-1,7-dioic acid hydratase in catechol pathway
VRFLVFDDNRLGILDGPDVLDATPLISGTIGASGPLHALIDREAASLGGESTRNDSVLTEQEVASLERLPLAAVTVRAPLPRPPKVVGAPVNYLDHKAEMSEANSIANLGVFLKAASSVIGPDELVRLPYSDVRTDQEGELAVVIGRTASNVSAEDALEYVFGYTCSLDMTVRSSEDRSTRKSFDTFTPLGPVVVTAAEIADTATLTLETRVNGSVRQQASVSELIFGVPELIAYTSSVMTLWPGDVVLTGTPAGVGPVGNGDRIEVEISQIGTLAVGVTDSLSMPYDTRPGARSAAMG